MHRGFRPDQETETGCLVGLREAEHSGTEPSGPQHHAARTVLPRPLPAAHQPTRKISPTFHRTFDTRVHPLKLQETPPAQEVPGGTIQSSQLSSRNPAPQAKPRPQGGVPPPCWAACSAKSRPLNDVPPTKQSPIHTAPRVHHAAPTEFTSVPRSGFPPSWCCPAHRANHAPRNRVPETGRSPAVRARFAHCRKPHP